MSILFNKSGVSHLTAGVGSGDTELRIPWSEFEQFYRAGVTTGDLMYAILRGPVYREIVAIDLYQSYNGQADKYLKVLRGQGGTSSRAWPPGTLLFLSTHADHYNSIFQPDGTRQITFNPNGVLVPVYRGEKVLQYTGCGIRWFQSFDGVNPYWHLIAGEPCEGEVFQDPGWGFAVWYSAAAACWDGKTQPAFWTPGSADTIWNPVDEWWETTSPNKWLTLNAPNGDWEVDYRPWLIRLKRPELTNSKVEMRSNNNWSLAQEGNLTPGDDLYDKPIGPDGREIETKWQWLPIADDIDFLRVYQDDSTNKVRLSGIDFRLCDRIVVPTKVGGYGDISRRDPTWLAAHGLGTGELVNTTSNAKIWACFTGGQYEIHRAFLLFDLTTISMTDLHFAVLTWATGGSHVPNTRKIIVNEGLQFIPLTVGHYNNFVQANVFTDPWDCTLFDNPWLVLNEDGLDYVKSKFGGDAKFCIRDYTKDYLDSAPFDNMQYDMVTPLELGLYSGNLWPRLILYGFI